MFIESYLFESFVA